MFASVSGQVNYAELGGNCYHGEVAGLSTSSLVNDSLLSNSTSGSNTTQVNYVWFSGTCYFGLLSGSYVLYSGNDILTHLWDLGSLYG